ncbi:hypothetical protein [Streptomyces justiciae]|uniref:hypothetical protein n=1 Tax=Streptomyces justiciae TaxID=2780140 RepID=UPI002118273B|nr:hypothetical protein [Streptomyces justiciae]MCW8382506.1 hypothetical protein [Streptomyces justiciae]
MTVGARTAVTVGVTAAAMVAVTAAVTAEAIRRDRLQRSASVFLAAALRPHAVPARRVRRLVGPNLLALPGVPVRGVQHAGLAGVFLGMGYMAFFVRDMTAGRGFIAHGLPRQPAPPGASSSPRSASAGRRP